MFKRIVAAPFRLNRLRLLILAPLVLLLILVATFVRVDFDGDFEGIYILKGPGTYSLLVQNDLYLSDENNLLFRLDFEPINDLFPADIPGGKAIPYLSYEWSPTYGRGFVINHLPDGKKLITCLGRFRDSDGRVPKGLFVGGGLPTTVKEDIKVTMNETGMAFYDGKEWQHLWCSVNEAIASVADPGTMLSPSTWKFLGSSVLHKNSKKLVLQSTHEVMVDGVPFSVKRHAFFRAGDNYLVLAVTVTNSGTRPTSYHYVYGDEPWVGEFGTSVGNVGWVKDRIYNYEGQVDTRKYSFAGMYDYGNKVILGGKAKFSGVANFIEWLGDNRPDLVYFSNQIGSFSQESAKVPLYSKDNRIIFLQWGPRVIQPGESHIYLLGIGMAGNDSGTGFPVKPEVVLDTDDYSLLNQR